MPKIKIGGKITASHTTATETAAIVLNIADKLDEVTKISLGIIKPAKGGGVRRLKISAIVGGIKVTVRGSGAVQELFIYTKTPDVTEEKLNKVFSE